MSIGDCPNFPSCGHRTQGTCDAVLYVPNHAHGDELHADCERGAVSSVNDTYVFVRYHTKVRAGSVRGVGVMTHHAAHDGPLKHFAQATLPYDLRKRS